MKAGFSYLGSCIHKLPEDSLENFYVNGLAGCFTEMFFEGYTEKLWGRHPREISADWGAQRVKGLSITAVVKDMLEKILPGKKGRKVETSLIEEFIYPKYGPGQLWETAAAEIEKMGGHIKKHCKVTGIRTENGKVKALETLGENGETGTVEGDIFISSMPLKDLVEGMGDGVPENIQAIAEGLPYRDFVTVGLLVDHPEPEKSDENPGR